MTKKVSIYFYALSAIALIGYIGLTIADEHVYSGWLLMLFFFFLALGFRGNDILRGYSFTIAIFAAVSLAMYYPKYFTTVGDFKLSTLIVPLLQLLMFGMGTSLGIRDFTRVLQMPKGVIAGVLCHYTVMPLVGWTVTKIFSFPDEIAAGIILIGSSPNGLASNVMSYLAKANLALSVTLTAISTMLAPLITPLFMNLLADQYVEVDFWRMAWDITKIIIFPIGAGLIFNYFLHGKFKWLDDIMPVLSMASIVLIIVVVTAAGRNDLMLVGPLLIFAVLVHNLSGYVLGYWISKGLRMPEKDCRTLALEVGLQNAGLASGIALAMGKLSTVGLAPAVFSPTMNITGSSLALWWRSKDPITDEKESEPIKHRV
jgi:bile acid:Na+ symporter, BASS family